MKDTPIWVVIGAGMAAILGPIGAAAICAACALLTFMNREGTHVESQTGGR